MLFGWLLLELGVSVVEVLLSFEEILVLDDIMDTRVEVVVAGEDGMPCRS